MGEFTTTRADLQSEVVQPPLGHQVVDQVLLLLHGDLADLVDVEVCVGGICAGLTEETVLTVLILTEGQLSRAQGEELTETRVRG